jgi:hypothetical protein
LDYNEAKKDRETLLSLLREYGGQRPLARELDCDHKAIKYWMDKYGITVEDYEQYEDELEFSGKEKYVDFTEEELDGDYYLNDENKYPYEKIDDIYIFRAPFGEFDVSKDILDRVLEDYCNIGLTKKETARDVGLSIKEVHVILKGYGVIHDSIPFRKEVQRELTPQEMADLSLEQKEALYYREIEQKQYKKAIRENKKYKEKDYLLKKQADRILENLEQVEYRPPEIVHLNEEKKLNKNTLVVNISDWHKGKTVLSAKILGNNELNKVIYQQRIDKFIEKVLMMLERHKPEKVLILNYGDGPDSPNADVYPGQREHQDVLYEEQVMGYVQDVVDFILTIHQHHQHVEYAGVPGNHSKGNINWDVLANMFIKELLKDYEDIKVDSENIEYKVHEIYDYYLVQFHGNFLTTKVDSPTAQKQALSILELEGLPKKRSYLCQGHLHHRAAEGPSYRRILLPSLVGGDRLSANMMQTGARPGQQIFVVEDGEGLTDEHNVFFDNIQ